eukprot:1950375-Rhodomonas_salina.1
MEPAQDFQTQGRQGWGREVGSHSQHCPRQATAGHEPKLHDHAPAGLAQGKRQQSAAGTPGCHSLLLSSSRALGLHPGC